MIRFLDAMSSEKVLRADLSRQRAFFLKALYQDTALNSLVRGVSSDHSTNVIISLTTFKQRINDVHLTIESLFQQSRKADRVVLWLSAEDFSADDIPAILQKQCERGLEIRFCEKDLGPYTKFYYALQAFPESLILTVDDDILYPLDLVDQLYRAYRKHPDMIHCHRAHKMLLDSDGEILPYKKWKRFTQNTQPALDLFPTGVGGVLYFPGCFDDEILNKEAFLRLSPNADDVWLKAMSLKKGTLCKKLEDNRSWSDRFVVIDGSQTVSLKRKNKDKKTGNDSQLKAVFDEYRLRPLLKQVE